MGLSAVGRAVLLVGCTRMRSRVRRGVGHAYLPVVLHPYPLPALLRLRLSEL